MIKRTMYFYDEKQANLIKKVNDKLHRQRGVGVTKRIKDSSEAENEKNLQEIIKGFPYYINLLNQEIAETRKSYHANGFKYNDYLNNLKSAKKILEDAILIAKTYSFSLGIEYGQEDNDKGIAVVIKKMSNAFKDVYKKIDMVSKKFEYIPEGLDERFDLYFKPLINAKP